MPGTNRPRISRSTVPFAFLAATGAAYISGGLVFAVVRPFLTWGLHFDELTNSIVYGPHTIGLAGVDSATTIALSTLTGAAAATIVARRAGGRAAVLLYGVLLLVTAAVMIGSAVEYQRRVSGECCVASSALNFPLGVALTLTPALLAVGIGLVRPLREARDRAVGTNAWLEAAGSYAFVAMVASFVVVPLDHAAVVLTPYLITQLEMVPHVALVVVQTLVALGVYAIRVPRVRPSAFGVFLVVALAAVLPSELEPLALTLVFQHVYVSLSLIGVPAAAIAGVALVLVARRVRGAAFAMTTT